jgi:predicted short-subunit dehydrogenase-like oxidoreductase (DUF2520 family)
VYDAEVLEPCARAGAATGSLHIAMAFASAERAVAQLRALRPAAAVSVEDAAWRARLIGMAEALGCYPLVLPASSKALYHAALSMASNFLVVLAAAAHTMLEPVGMRAEDRQALLLPLLRATLHNLAEAGPTAALTGPLARGDVDTVAAHLAALRAPAFPPELAAAYTALANLTLALLPRHDLPTAALAHLHRTLYPPGPAD